MLICKLIGHKYKQFLQETFNNTYKDYDGKCVFKTVYTVFKCLRCDSTFKQETLFRKSNGES